MPFSALLFTHLRSFTLSQKKTNSNCCTAALAVYLLVFSASYYLHSPSTASGARYMRSACIYMDMLRLVAAACVRHGLNFSTAWCTMRLISIEKDWKHVSVQKAITLNTCCDVACLTFQLPHITSGSFQSHRRQPTTYWLSSEPPTFERTQQTFSQMNKVLQFTSYCGGIFRWGWQVDYSLFSSEIR